MVSPKCRVQFESDGIQLHGKVQVLHHLLLYPPQRPSLKLQTSPLSDGVLHRIICLCLGPLTSMLSPCILSMKVAKTKMKEGYGDEEMSWHVLI